MIVKKHNRKLINKKEAANQPCNCRNQATCPLKGRNCRTESVIYETTVSTTNDTKTIGLTANQKELLHTKQQSNANLNTKTVINILTQQNSQN